MKQVGKYTVFENEKIGSGQQGAILKCLNTQTNEQCCVKAINTDAVMQFQDRENEILNTIQKNPCCNVLKIYDIILQDHIYFVFMELCNYDLEELIKKRQNYWFSVEEIYSILGQIVNGYQHLRKYNIMHRDLKPQNILIKELNNKKILIKIADFGVGIRQTNSRIAVTNAGTPLYQAPEVTQEQSYTDQCDIYSLGLILYKLCFQGQQYAEVKTLYDLKRFHEQLQNQPFICPYNQLERGLVQLIEQMIVYDPKRRITWDKLQQIQKLQPQFIILNDLYFVDYTNSLGGGMQGQTFLTLSLQKNEQFCTKIIDNTQEESQREIQIYKKLKGNHRCVNVIHLVDCVEEGSKTYLILEKCDESIEQYCSRQQLSDAEICDILAQIVNGYCHLKDLEIIHRDLKPQNILVKSISSKPMIKIIDFGVGKIVANRNVATTMAGTPIYSAPEVLEGGAYDYQCDVFSLGVMLHYILYGKQYIEPRNYQELQYHLKSLKTNPFRCPSFPEKNKDLKELIEQMLRYYPNERITWDQLKQHRSLQQHQKIKIISQNQVQQESIIQQQPVIQQSNHQQIQPRNDKIKFYPPIKMQPSSNIYQQMNQETRNQETRNQETRNQETNFRQQNNFFQQPLNDQPRKSSSIFRRSDSNNEVNQSARNIKFDLKLALQNCFQLLHQRTEMDLPQYLYCLLFFLVKVSLYLQESEIHNEVIKEFYHLICYLEMQGLSDLVNLQRDKRIKVDGDEYQLPDNYPILFEEKDVENLIQEIVKLQKRYKPRQSKDNIWKNNRYLINFAKKKQPLTIYDLLSFYQEIYRTQQQNILENDKLADKTKFYLEKIYQIKSEIPIEQHQTYSAQKIMCKIQTGEMINKYLEERRQKAGL